jgi:hypothetical protein
MDTITCFGFCHLLEIAAQAFYKIIRAFDLIMGAVQKSESNKNRSWVDQPNFW